MLQVANQMLPFKLLALQDLLAKVAWALYAVTTLLITQFLHGLHSPQRLRLHPASG